MLDLNSTGEQKRILARTIRYSSRNVGGGLQEWVKHGSRKIKYGLYTPADSLGSMLILRQ